LFAASNSLFIVIDPFMLIGKNRGKIKITSEYDVTWNRDFQSTELFLKNYDNQKYNSFIMGNSRSFFYSINLWENYINGNCFHLTVHQKVCLESKENYNF
jgi:hypothetical protein